MLFCLAKNWSCNSPQISPWNPPPFNLFYAHRNKSKIENFIIPWSDISSIQRSESLLCARPVVTNFCILSSFLIWAWFVLFIYSLFFEVYLFTFSLVSLFLWCLFNFDEVESFIYFLFLCFSWTLELFFFLKKIL